MIREFYDSGSGVARVSGRIEDYAYPVTGASGMPKSGSIGLGAPERDGTVADRYMLLVLTAGTDI